MDKPNLHEHPSQPEQSPAAHSQVIKRKSKDSIAKEKGERLFPLPLLIIEYSSLEALYKLTESKVKFPREIQGYCIPIPIIGHGEGKSLTLF